MPDIIRNLPVRFIRPGQNDRTVFAMDGLQELADSIREHGLAQPITVRPIGAEQYEIVAGERRFRAIATILRWEDIPCIVRELSDAEASAIMLAENIGRRDLDPVDEALAYKKRMETLGWNETEIGKRCGVSPERVKKRLRLCTVREDILHHVRRGAFPVGHAEMLSPLDRNRQMLAARPIIEGRPINARQFRALVDELLAQQAQDNLFSLALFGGALEVPQVQVSKYLALPVADDLPPVAIPEEKHVGAILLAYIGTLQAAGFTREADTLGTVLKFLLETNYARVPALVSLQANGLTASVA